MLPPDMARNPSITSCVTGNSLLGVERDIFNNDLFIQLERLKPQYFDETDAKKKASLKQKIDDLINLCADLNRENVSLKADASSWTQERKQLLDKNELAKTKVEAIISRLKAMEQDS